MSLKHIHCFVLRLHGLSTHKLSLHFTTMLLDHSTKFHQGGKKLVLIVQAIQCVCSSISLFMVLIFYYYVSTPFTGP